MSFPERRLRRLRRTPTWRRMVRETRLSVDDLVYPMFVVPGKGVRNEVPSMPGVFQLSVDELVRESVEIHRPGKFYGSLQTPALTVEKGVVLEGTCKMENLGSGSVFSKDKGKPKDNNKPQDAKPAQA